MAQARVDVSKRAFAERKKQAHNGSMLYKFKSKATGDLIMLEPQGRQIIKIIGKEPGAQGIIEPKDMMAAIDALQQAVVREEEVRLEAEREAQKEIQRAAEGVAADLAKSGAHTASDKGAISLKQRVVPFIDMLRRAHAEDKDIVWGV
jgi:hypothetical protein